MACYDPNWEEGYGDNHNRMLQVKQVLLQAIKEELTPRQRQMLLLYYFERKKTPQIAEELGVHKSTVSRTIHRGIEKIERMMKYCALR